MKKTALRMLTLFMALLLLLSLAACGSSGSSAGGSPDLDYNGAPGDAYLEDKENSSAGSSDISLPENRIIIKTVNETVETLEYDAFLTALNEAVATAGGYFSSSSYRDGSYNSTALRTATLVIRVPADKLTVFCNEVDGIGHVTSFYETVDDITLAYVAIESRIEVLVSEESALLTMLSKAGNISDMLAIRKQLEGVQGELAELRAQKRVYDDQVAYSTVNMTVREVKRVSEETDQMTYGQEIGYTFMESLYSVGNFFRAASIFLVGNSPVLLLWAIVIACVVLLVRLILRRNRQNKD
ncbi:MAG: DUF4349 domain-containing protein [Clostridia bacterium]|nr:DUF4349 domain-containing protein [Clostridia bacterium]